MLNFDSMQESCTITKAILEACKKHILAVETISTLEVNNYAEMQLTRHGVVSAFQGVHDFPHVMCISLNDAIVHGLPSEDVVIKKGDIVSLDFGVILDGHYSDMAISFVNSNKDSGCEKHRLVRDTKKALDDAVDMVNRKFPNSSLYNITTVIDSYKLKYGIVKHLGGHAIGHVLHDPALYVANSWADFIEDVKLKPGMYFTIEPLFTLGSDKFVVDEDGFTMKTKDGSLAAHWEYTLAVTNEGIIILGGDG